MTYRSRISELWLLLLVLFFGSASLGARSVKVGVYNNPPKTYLSDTGTGDGIFFDVLREIARREGWDLIYVPGSWDTSLAALENGSIDIMPDLAYSEERAVKYSFHDEPVLTSWSQIYSRKGMGIRSIPDMQGKRVAILEGSIQQTALEDITRSFSLDVEYLPYSSFDEAFKSVSDGAADMVATNMFYGTLQARTFGLEDTGIVFEPSSLFFATKKGFNLDLLEAVDKQLIQMKSDNDSPYFQAIRDWHPYKNEYKMPLWLKILALVLGLILVIGVISSLVLRHQVRQRTLELSESNREMESRIILRTAQLEAAMLKAQESDVLKSAFLATMSHELRTPLNSIIGFTGILLQELPGKLNEEQRKQLSMVQKSSRHLLELINEVLDISKIEAGQLDLYPESFLLKDSIEKMYDLILPGATAKNLTFTYHLDSPETELFQDKRRLEQIILNLLSNAVKFTEKGSISISCQTTDNIVIISVCDTGLGISAQHQAHVFQPFRQIDSGLTRKYDGTGLGLSISQKLAQLLGGTITLQSSVGVGSTFSIKLPLRLEKQG